MRETLIGVALAVTFIAAMFVWDRLGSHPEQDIAQSAAQIQAGYTGIKAIGPWQLVCAARPAIIAGSKTPPLPLVLSPSRRPAPSSSGISLGRCRVTLEYRQKEDPRKVVIAVSFRLAGEARKVLMIVRLPAIAAKGDELAVRLGTKGLKLPVANCGKGGCIAVAPLSMEAQSALFAAPRAELVLPPGKDGKRAGLPFPTVGLAPAIDAMGRAES